MDIRRKEEFIPIKGPNWHETQLLIIQTQLIYKNCVIIVSDIYSLH